MKNGKSETICGWELFEPEVVLDAKIFDVCKIHVKCARRAFEADYHLIRSVDWVSIIPLTPANEVVFIEQFRPAIRETCLELPGGNIERTDPHPLHSALRELQEETGYTSSEIESLGFSYPNPGVNTAKHFHFVARNVHPNGGRNLDPGEDISVRLIPLSEVPQLILNQKLTNGLMINLFAKLFMKNGTFSGAR